MKRLILAIGAAACLLLLVSLTRTHAPAHHRANTPQTTWVQPDPSTVAHDYLTALIAGDIRSAEVLSTPLLARQLTAEPLGPAAGRLQPASMDLYVLDQTRSTTDIAVELHWANGRLAALRIQLVRQEDGWLVAAVQQ